MDYTLSPALRSELDALVQHTLSALLAQAQTQIQSQEKEVRGDDSGPSVKSSSADLLSVVSSAVLQAVQSTLSERASTHNTEAKSVPVSTLPPELLGSIFHNLPPPPDSSRDSAAQTCRHWRAVAHADATLWTAHTLSHAGTGAVSLLGPQLDRTRGAPLSLDLNLRDHRASPRLISEARVTELSDVLGKHIDHTRDLRARIHARTDAEKFLAALSLPAPDLETLHLVNLTGNPPPSTTTPAGSSGALSLPADMFAGRAPRLRSAVLERFALPPGAERLPAWDSLEDLAFSAPEAFASADLSIILRSCPSLRRLALVLRDTSDGAQASRNAIDTAQCPNLQSVYAEGGGFRTDHGLVPTLARFAELPSVTEIGVACPTDTELSLILGMLDAGCEKMSIVTRTGYSFSLAASMPMPSASNGTTPSEGVEQQSEEPTRTFRAWKLHLHHFTTIFRSTPPSTMASLRELTIAEALWSEGPHPLPEMPHLRVLGLVLAVEKEYFDPGASWGSNFGGVWQMAMPRRRAETTDASDATPAGATPLVPPPTAATPNLPADADDESDSDSDDEDQDDVPDVEDGPVAVTVPTTEVEASVQTAHVEVEDSPEESDDVPVVPDAVVLARDSAPEPETTTTADATNGASSSIPSDATTVSAATAVVSDATNTDGSSPSSADSADASAATAAASTAVAAATAATAAATPATAVIPPPPAPPATTAPASTTTATTTTAPPKWSLPSLQTFRLISSAPSPPTISTRDVSLLMTHHLNLGTRQPKQLPSLELMRVRLYDEEVMRGLEVYDDGPTLGSCVRTVVELDETEGRFKAYWDSMFADVSWAGAIGASDNWATR
ncbi:hypothetical protein BKA62DRAFT_831864 [Auriculariales sp. MPI-PUGE-AT-0066]|nr:hypothetical protein BKA62DRAFT_831864 [Auriculariales sp. MPI-PUGE-AT-0066]